MKAMKRIASLMLALVMIVALAIPVFAINTEDTPNNTAHTITITEPAANHTYEAYQILRGDMSGGVLTNITWGNGVDGAKLQAALKTVDAFKDCASAEDVAKVLATFANNSDALDAFAEVVEYSLTTAQATAKAGEDAASLELSVTGDGYYLLKDSNKYIGAGEAYTKYVLEVTKDTITVELKDSAPGLEKTTTVTNGSIGDQVPFKLTSKVPTMDGYDTYYYIVHDTLSAGLTFNDDVVVTLGGNTLTAGTDYNVEKNGQQITIVFLNFIQYKNAESIGDEIVITYSATINEQVNLVQGEKNTAYLEYSNDPNYDYNGDADNDSKPDPNDPTGVTPESTVKVYSTGIKLTKVDGENALTGAQFQIAGESLKVVMINKTIFKESETGTYYRLKNGTYTETAPAEGNADAYESTTVKYEKVETVTKDTVATEIETTGWVGADGVITFEGLGAGTYTITELIAPEGYNLLQSPITVVITYNGDGNFTATVNNSSDNVNISDGVISFNVQNKKGTTLPSTGGMGTTIFYVLGACMVLGAVVLLVTKKRMNAM